MSSLSPSGIRGRTGRGSSGRNRLPSRWVGGRLCLHDLPPHSPPRPSASSSAPPPPPPQEGLWSLPTLHLPFGVPVTHGSHLKVRPPGHGPAPPPHQGSGGTLTPGKALPAALLSHPTRSPADRARGAGDPQKWVRLLRPGDAPSAHPQPSQQLRDLSEKIGAQMSPVGCTYPELTSHHEAWGRGDWLTARTSPRAARCSK